MRIAVDVTSECECEIWDGFLQFGPIPQLALCRVGVAILRKDARDMWSVSELELATN